MHNTGIQIEPNLNLSMYTRPMEPTDIPRLVEIDAESNNPPWSGAMFERELGLPFSVCLAATANRGNAPIGFGVIWCIEESAQLIQLAVSAQHRGKGVGTLLMQNLFTQAQERGTKNMTLEVRETNLAAIALYKHFGFQATGNRPKFYGNENALLMTCEIK